MRRKNNGYQPIDLWREERKELKKEKMKEILMIVSMGFGGLAICVGLAVWYEYYEANKNNNANTSMNKDIENMNSPEERKVEIKNFDEGTHNIDILINKDTMENILNENHVGYEITGFSYSEKNQNDVVVTYTNTVEVEAVGIDGVFNTFGVPVENTKKLTYNK